LLLKTTYIFESKKEHHHTSLWNSKSPRKFLHFFNHHHRHHHQSSFSFLLDVDRYVKTTDGTKFVFKPGDVLFQDNTKNSPANKQPEHYSGVVGDQPCQQMIVQLSRPPQVNEPNPF